MRAKQPLPQKWMPLWLWPFKSEFPRNQGIPKRERQSICEKIEDGRVVLTPFSCSRWSENVRTNRKLFIKISEAKDLPKGQNALRTGLITEKWESLSTYVVIQVDTKEVARTDTLAKNVRQALFFYSLEWLNPTISLPFSFFGTKSLPSMLIPISKVSSSLFGQRPKSKVAPHSDF